MQQSFCFFGNRRLVRLCAISAAAASLLTVNPVTAAFVSTVSGGNVTMSGDSAGDILNIYVEGGLLEHNRSTAGDAGFNSNFDFDTNLSGDQTISAAAAPILTLNGGTGNDSITVNDQDDPGYHTYALNASSMLGRFTVNFSSFEYANYYVADHATSVKVTGTAAGIGYYINSQGLSPVFVENASQTLDDILGELQISSKATYAILRDTGHVGSLTYLIAPDQGCCTWVGRLGGALVKIAGVDTIELSGGPTSNVFDIIGTNQTLMLFGGNGPDTATVSNFGTLATLTNVVDFSGGDGVDSLTFSNADNALPEAYTIKARTLTKGADKIGHWSNVENVHLLTGTSADNISVTPAVSSFNAAVDIDGGQFGQGDILEVLYDTGADSPVIGASTITGSFGGNAAFPISYNHIDSLIAHGLDGADSFTVTPSANTEMNLAGEGAASGADILSIVSGGSAYLLTADTFTMPGRKPVHFTGFEQVSSQAQPHGPDLIGFWGMPLIKCKTGSSGIGCSIKATLLQVNNGDQPSAVGMAQFFMSDDDKLDNSDVELTPRAVKALNPGGYAATKLSAKLPIGTDPAGKYLIGKLDGSNSSAETWESNNTVVVGPLAHP